MKHVNEELPDVQQRRPEVSAAAALVVERATAKDPNQRYQEIGDMIDDLSTALEVEAARAGSSTGEATSILDALPPPKRKLSGRARWSWAAIALIVLIGGGAVAAVAIIGGGNTPGGGGGALKDKGKTVPLASATDYDPDGDGQEGSDTVELAVDGNLSSAWSSEHYADEEFAGTKTGDNPGVGLYVTTESPASPKVMVIHTPSPGWDAQIYATASEPPEEVTEWGEPIGEVTNADKNEEVELHLAAPATNFLLWFTKAAPTPGDENSFGIEISDVKLID